MLTILTVLQSTLPLKAAYNISKTSYKIENNESFLLGHWNEVLLNTAKDQVVFLKVFT